MATSPFGPYADISRYQQAAAQPVQSPLNALIQGFQGGQAIRNLPQTIAQNQLEQQLANAVARAKLQELQMGPAPINVGGVGLVVRDPNSPDGFRVAVPMPTKIATASPKLYVNPATGESDYFSPGAQPKGFQAYFRTPTGSTGSGSPKIYVNPLTNQSKYFVPGTEPEGFQAYLPGSGKGKGGGEAQEAAASEFAEERTQRNLDSVKDLKADVSSFTVGAGSLFSFFPGSDAADFQANVDTLKANIAFNELQAMRNASKTGGALGQVAVRELELLQSALGSLSTRQSKGSFLKNLDKIEKSISRFEKATDTPTEETPTPKNVKPDTKALPIIKITPRKAP